MKLTYEIRNVYGNEVFYPENKTAKTFAKIAGTKTLKRETLRLARELGYQVVQVIPNCPAVLAEALLAEAAF